GDDAAMGLEQDGGVTLEGDETRTEPLPGKAAVKMDKVNKGSEQLVAEKAGEALAGAMAEAAKAGAEQNDSKKILDRRFDVVIDESRDALLTEFGKETLVDRYLLPGEKFQDL